MPKVIQKRFVAMVSLAVVFLVGIGMQAARADTTELTEVQKLFLKQKGTIKFVSQTHYPPFEFVGLDRNHNGMCIELIRWIATEFEFKAYFTDTSFKQAQNAVLSSHADVLTSFFYSKKRDKIFDFTEMMFEVPASIFVAAERPDIKEIGDLQGKTIAMQAGDYAEEFLKGRNIQCFFKYTSSFAEATDLVITKSADAIIGDEQIVLYHIYSNNLTKQIKKVGSPLYIGQNCMGLRESDGTLVEILNKGIKLAQKKGVLEQIYRKWLGTTYAPSLTWIQKFYPFFLMVFGAVALVSLLVWTWNLKLREKVAIRTAELSKSEKTLRTILDASPLGIGLSEKLTFEWCNPFMGRMLGYENHELIGKNINAIFRHADQMEPGRELMQSIGDNDSEACLETQGLRKDGTHFDCRLRFAYMQLGNRSMTLVIAEDVSKQKKNLNQAKRLNRLNETLIASDKLEDKLKRITDTVVSIFNADFARIWIVRSGDFCNSGCVIKENISNADTSHCPKACLHLCASSGRYTRVDGSHQRVPLGAFKIGRIAAGHEPNFLTNDVLNEPMLHDYLWAKQNDLNSFAGYRLMSNEGSVMGVLALFSRFKIMPEENAMLENLAGTTARVIYASQTESDLKQSEKRFRAVIEQAAVGVSLCESYTGRFIKVNTRYCDIIGYTETEILSRNFQEITHPEDLHEDLEFMNQMINGSISNFSMEKRYLHKNGSVIWIRLTVSPMWEKGELPSFHIAIVEDITEQKHAEIKIKESLKEKEILLREIHHRVKNNMQVISSLLSLQAEQIKDINALAPFTDTQARVQAMALIHDALYQSENFDQVLLQTYLELLAQYMLDIYTYSGKTADIVISAQNIVLKMDHTIPCGLVVVELISNALKYAKPPDSGLTIKIEAGYDTDTHLMMCVSDNGSSIQPEVNFLKANTLGLQMVTEIISDQLEGTYEVDLSKGVIWTIKWPI